MNPERDETGNVKRDSKGRPVIDKSLNDTEIIPWLTDRNEYLQKNVAPYSPDFIVDEKKTKIGYEIPFTRRVLQIYSAEALCRHLRGTEGPRTAGGRDYEQDIALITYGSE